MIDCLVGVMVLCLLCFGGSYISIGEDSNVYMV